MRAILFLIILLVGAGARAEPVDLELILAVDTSRSMDIDELRLQREGYAAALEHPAVASALSMGEHGKTALFYFEWGGEAQYRVLLDWTVIETAEDAAAAAAVLRQAPLAGLRGTSISFAMEQALFWFEESAFEGRRRVLDISGDGPNNQGRPVTEARDALAAAGIEINGLPFMVKRPGGYYSIPDLDFYYEDCVITGTQAFVIPIFEMDRLVASIRQKLVLEISGLRPLARDWVWRAAGFDCLIGEKLMRQRALDMDWNN